MQVVATNQILNAENFDKEYQNLKEKTTENERSEKKTDLSLNGRGLLLHKNKLYIPNSADIKLTVVVELHKRPYSGHPRYQKMITMIRKDLFWPNMKKEVAEYLARCIECQHVKDEHQHPVRLLQPSPIRKWKWEIISMDLITGLPKNVKQRD